MTLPLVIEFAGIPGSGKSSLCDLVATNLRSDGHNARTVVEAARMRSGETGLGKLIAGSGRGRLSRLGNWWLFYCAATARAAAVVWKRKRALGKLAMYQWRRPIKLRLKAHIAWWYFQLGGRRSFLQSSRSIDAVLFDDGYVHRSVALFSSPSEKPPESAIRHYIREIPAPSAIVQIIAPLDTCVVRVIERGVWSHSKDMTESELRKYLSSAHYVLAIGIAEARSNGIPVFTFSNDGIEVDEVARQISRELTDLLATRANERRAS